MRKRLGGQANRFNRLTFRVLTILSELCPGHSTYTAVTTAAPANRSVSPRLRSAPDPRGGAGQVLRRKAFSEKKTRPPVLPDFCRQRAQSRDRKGADPRVQLGWGPLPYGRGSVLQPLDHAREEAVALLLAGNPTVDCALFERCAHHHRIDYRFVLLRFERASGIHEPPSRSERLQRPGQYGLLPQGEVVDVRQPELPLDFGIASQRPGAGARHVHEDPVEARGERKGSGGIQRDQRHRQRTQAPHCDEPVMIEIASDGAARPVAPLFERLEGFAAGSGAHVEKSLWSIRPQQRGDPLRAEVLDPHATLPEALRAGGLAGEHSAAERQLRRRRSNALTGQPPQRFLSVEAGVEPQIGGRSFQRRKRDLRGDGISISLAPAVEQP